MPELLEKKKKVKEIRIHEMVSSRPTERQLAIQSKARHLLWFDSTSDLAGEHPLHPDLSASVNVGKYLVLRERAVAFFQADIRINCLELDVDIKLCR